MAKDYNPHYDGKTVFFLDVAKLLPGDIILTRNRLGESKMGRKQSSIIAAFGKSNFSHAMICLVPPTMIEAISSGVSTHSVANSFYHEEDNVRVLRYCNPKFSELAAGKAALSMGKPYSVRMAIKSILPELQDANEPQVKTFCSALVAAAFRGSGAPEFQSINPHRITPGHLFHMECLDDVTSQVSYLDAAPINIEEMSALDGERQPSPFAGQAKALLELHVSVADDIDVFVCQWNLPFKIPTTFYETLEFLLEALKSPPNGDDLLKEVYISALQSIDRKLANAMDNSNLQNMNEEAEALETKTLIHILQESFEPVPDIDITSTRAMLKATADQISSRSGVLEEPHRAPGLSHAWDRWCVRSNSDIEFFKIRQTTLHEILGRIDPSYSVTS